MHPISNNRSGLPFSLFLSKVIEKKYGHCSKWVYILRYPSHSVTKVVMLPIGVQVLQLDPVVV
jgi:hypothetical protein